MTFRAVKTFFNAWPRQSREHKSLSGLLKISSLRAKSIALHDTSALRFFFFFSASRAAPAGPRQRVQRRRPGPAESSGAEQARQNKAERPPRCRGWLGGREARHVEREFIRQSDGELLGLDLNLRERVSTHSIIIHITQ